MINDCLLVLNANKRQVILTALLNSENFQMHWLVIFDRPNHDKYYRYS